MRTVVTGGAGFIGSHLIEALVARGDDVLCVERPGAPNRWLESMGVPRADCGLADEAALRRHFDGADVVFHLAALTEARTAEDFHAVNVEGTARVMRAAAALGPRAPRVVFLSSLAAVGPCREAGRLDADATPHPLSEYGRSKLAAEAVIHAFAGRVPSVILRFPAVYGPRERAALKMFQMVMCGIAVTVGTWRRQFSLLYVADAVDALLAAAAEPTAVGKTWCIAHPDPVTWEGFATTAGKALGKDPLLLSIPVRAARVLARVFEGWAAISRRAAILNRDRVRELSSTGWVCDPTPAMEQIHFRPRWPISRGIVETAGWYREEGWI